MSPPPSTESDRKLRLHALSMGVGFLALIAMVAWAFVHDREAHFDHQRMRSAEMAATLARYTRNELETIDRALTKLAADVSVDPRALVEPGRVERIVDHVQNAGNPAVGYGLVDARGDVVAMAPRAPPGVRISLAERPAFRLHRDSADPAPHISEPYLSRPSGLKIFSMSRRISSATGEFLGIVAATIQSEKLFEVLEGIGRIDETRLVIARADGIVLACVPTCLLGANISDRPAFKAINGGRLSGHVDGVAPIDGRRTITSFRVLEGVPLVALIATPSDVVGSSWLASVLPYLALSILLIGAMMVASVAHLRALRRQFAAEHARRQSSERLLQASVESLTSGFAVFDRENRLLLWNRRFLELFPYLRSVAATGAEFAVLARALVDHNRPELAPEKREGMIERLCAQSLKPAATRRWRDAPDRIIEVQHSLTEDGMTVRVYRDVTDEERHEAELLRALHAEREMNAQQRRFVAVVSHEFRTPLTVIDGAVQIIDTMQPADASPAIRTRIVRIRQAVRQMVELIERILSNARYADGQVVRCDEPLDIVGLVRSVCERQGSISAEFEIAVTADAAALEIVGDPRLLEQVVTNLVTNAVKYSGRARKVEVAVGVADDEVSITVRDHGVGIDADEIAKLFTRFYRAKTSRGVAGTGLGLHLSKDLVAMHGGRIDVSSELGKGSTFTIHLPRIASPIAPRRNAA